MFDDFLAHLHRGGAYGYYHYLPQRRSVWYEVGAPPPIDPAQARANLYFSVHPSRDIPPANAWGEVKEPAWVRSQLKFIAAVNCLFAEYDCKDYGDVAAILAHIDGLAVPAPSVLVASGGGVHAYWLLKEAWQMCSEARLEAAKLVQARWVALVGGDGGAKDLCRVLRVPGSRNYKYEPARWVEWLKTDLALAYPLRTLTACLPPLTVPSVEPVRHVGAIGGPKPIEAFNQAADVGAELARRGYTWQGSHKMLSPYSSTGQAGVTIRDNRAYVHHGSDPLCDGYWKRPFDVVRILDHGGDFKRALAAIRGDA
jgi:RepB DNA-primase from phage plasmid